jgi:hypothetical protein
MASPSKQSFIDQAAEFAEKALPAFESAMESAKEVAGPLLADAKEVAGPALADGKALASQKATEAKAAAVAALVATKEAVEKLPTEPEPEPSKRRWLKRLLIAAGLAALGGFVFSKLRKDEAEDSWDSSYEPAPAPVAADESPADDGAGAAPDEALADAAEEPHQVTTPDDPAEVVEVSADEGASKD